PLVSYAAQPDAQASVPARWPRLSQVAPPSAAPSHSSLPPIAPSPQRAQPLVSSVHDALQAIVPLSKPCDAQVAPPRSAPSHGSPASSTPLPQIEPTSEKEYVADAEFAGTAPSNAVTVNVRAPSARGGKVTSEVQGSITSPVSIWQRTSTASA